MALPHYVFILFLTVKAEAKETIAGLDNGADGILVKPVSEEEMLARLRSGGRILKLERRLGQLACVDSLTGLLTQRAFYRYLDTEWHRSRRFRFPLSCVMLDLDYFKQVNDVYGHPAGDSVLKLVAELLIDNSRACDTVCRYGGDEFCAMLPQTAEANAAVWAERTRTRLAALLMPVAGRHLRITASFGVAEVSGAARSSAQIVDLADQALLWAKSAGRDRTVRYTALAGDGSTQRPPSRCATSFSMAPSPGKS